MNNKDINGKPITSGEANYNKGMAVAEVLSLGLAKPLSRGINRVTSKFKSSRTSENATNEIVSPKSPENIAREFLEEYNASNIDRHIQAINLEKPVSVDVLPKGSVLYRYSKVGSNEPKEYFFSEENTPPGALGKNSMYEDPSQYVLEKFTLNRPVKVLNSTVNLFPEAGEAQVFSTEISNASTVEIIKRYE